MGTMHRTSILLTIATLLFVIHSTTAMAVNKFWVGPANSVGSWNTATNWAPPGAPSSADQVIIDSDTDSELNSDFVIGVLNVGNGGSVDTNGQLLNVSSHVSIGSTSPFQTPSQLFISEHNSGASTTAFLAQSIVVEASGEFLLEGGRAEILTPASNIELFENAGVVGGHGVLRFIDQEAVLTTRLANIGEFRTTRPMGSSTATRYTLALEAVDPLNSLVSIWTDPSTVTEVVSMTTLDIDTNFDGNLGGTLNLAAGAIIDTTDHPTSQGFPNTMRVLATGQINVDASTVAAGVPKTAILQGPLLELTAGAVLNINSGTLILKDGLTANNMSTIAIEGGGALQVDAPVASTIGGDINIGGPNAQLIVNSSLTIDDSKFDWDGNGNATTTVNNGGVLTINANNIDAEGNNVFGGTINVNGGDLITNIGGGWTVAGTMDISNGTVSSAESMHLNGSNTLISGLSHIDAPLELSNAASIKFTQSGDRLEVSGDMTIDATADFSGAGELAASGSTVDVESGAEIGVHFENSGELHVGDGPGAVEFSSFEQSSNGELFIEIGGTGSSQYDRLFVDGGATLDGQLHVDLLSGYAPAAGDAFTIVTSPNLNGTFNNSPSTFGTLPSGLFWEIDYQQQALVLSIGANLSADFDGDGDVDSIDLTHPTLGWQARYGNDLDGANFLDWQRQLGSGTALEASLNLVPEPSTTFLLALCAVISCAKRRCTGPTC